MYVPNSVSQTQLQRFLEALHITSLPPSDRKHYFPDCRLLHRCNSAMYIFIPVMLPVCKALGYDVVAFGVMATVNLAIGQVTPPVGVNLFVAIGIKIKKGMEVTLQEISKAVMPMLAACVGRASCGYLYSGNFNGSSESTC